MNYILVLCQSTQMLSIAEFNGVYFQINTYRIAALIRQGRDVNVVNMMLISGMGGAVTASVLCYFILSSVLYLLTILLISRHLTTYT